MQSLIAALAIMIAAGFVIVLPRSKGCLAWLVRFPALLVGSIGPLVVLWPRPLPSQIQVLPIVIGLALLIVSVAALTLVGLAWQVILKRSEGTEDALPAELFDPSLYFGSMTNLSANDSIDSCLFGLAVMALGALFILGLLLAGVIEHALLPDVDTAAKRALRVVLAFSYGILLQIAIFFLLNNPLAGLVTGATQAS
jgi:hypothetical protein